MTAAMPALPTLILLASLFSALCQAEIVQIPLTQQGDSALPRPTKGMSKAEVEKMFGAPESSQGPVGKPPITRWQYPAFVVLFEHDHVVHSVLKHKPAAAIEEIEPMPAIPTTPAESKPPMEQ